MKNLVSSVQVIIKTMVVEIRVGNSMPKMIVNHSFIP